jgi:hypothetical protein
MNRQPLYALAMHVGPYLYVGQAQFVDDDGLPVEHDWVAMVPVGGGDEVWVAPEDVTPWAEVAVSA